ncbi:hypothetical protein AVEN_261078-1 [Araneus ventricosus]|uniref:Uncharacterized protein n=1 Tax=Araneus ventricosus TaxID=182803 RepID=A0A4Y2L2Q7_ARAVE|nr:hypothetical protein AVEN_261078-1 [Araneus ventricosus]
MDTAALGIKDFFMCNTSLFSYSVKEKCDCNFCLPVLREKWEDDINLGFCMKTIGLVVDVCLLKDFIKSLDCGGLMMEFELWRPKGYCFDTRRKDLPHN